MGTERRDASAPIDAASVDAGTDVDASVETDGGVPELDGGPVCPRARVMVAAGEYLNIRPDPTTSMDPVGRLFDGTVVEVVGMARGETVSGSDLWYEITAPAGDGFIHSAFAACTEDPIPEDVGYYLPFACGASVRVTQAPGGALSHTGRTMYAYDFGVGLDTPIHAMRAGTVTAIRTTTRPGDDCYDGGGSACGPYANWVILQHADGNTSAYKHLNSATVAVGDSVAQGQVIGRSGSTGYSTGPHLHQELRGNCPTEIYCQTIQLTFADVGRPTAGDTVTSANCP